MDKYAESLERARELLNSPRTCFDIDQLKSIFPELAESENEKIRLALIEHLKYCADCADCVGVRTVTKDMMLAWLEKQKKTLPTEGVYPYNNPADTLDGEIESIWNKLSCEGKFTATRSGFEEVVRHFYNWFEKKKPADIQPKLNLNQHQGIGKMLFTMP